MTLQVPDKLQTGTLRWFVVDYAGGIVPPASRDLGFETEMRTTANSRGRVDTFAIEQNRLVLRHITANLAGEPSFVPPGARWEGDCLVLERPVERSGVIHVVVPGGYGEPFAATVAFSFEEGHLVSALWLVEDASLEDYRDCLARWLAEQGGPPLERRAPLAIDGQALPPLVSELRLDTLAERCELRGILASCPALRRLAVPWWFEDSHTEELRSCRALTELSLALSSVERLDGLDALPLSALDLRGVQLADASAWAEMSRLRTLVLDWSTGATPWLDALPTDLHRLSLVASGVESLAFCSRLVGLRELDISLCDIDSVAVLGELKRLSRLIAVGTPLRGLEALEGLGIETLVVDDRTATEAAGSLAKLKASNARLQVVVAAPAASEADTTLWVDTGRRAFTTAFVGAELHAQSIRSGRLLLGRASEADLRIDHPAVSRYTAVLDSTQPVPEITLHPRCSAYAAVEAPERLGPKGYMLDGTRMRFGSVFAMVRDATKPQAAVVELHAARSFRAAVEDGRWRDRDTGQVLDAGEPVTIRIDPAGSWVSLRGRCLIEPGGTCWFELDPGQEVSSMRRGDVFMIRRGDELVVLDQRGERTVPPNRLEGVASGFVTLLKGTEKSEPRKSYSEQVGVLWRPVP